MLKKFTSLLFILTLFACSSDDNSNSSNSNSLTIKKITETLYEDGPEPYTYSFDFNYENGVLKNIQRENVKLEFIYEGDNIVKSNQYDGTTILESYTIIYEGNNIKALLQDDNNEKSEYVFQNDVLKSKTYYFSNDGIDWDPNEITNYVFTNGNVTEQRYSLLSGGVNTSKTTYTYDEKNNPMRNMNKHLRYLLPLYGFSLLNANNAMTQNFYNTLESTTPSQESRYEIVYNSDNFPIEIKRIMGTNNLRSKTVIEYN